jgi:hypothetical protein
MDLCTRTTATATLAVPLAITVGVVGLVLSRPWQWRPGWSNPVTAVVTYAAYAAPIVLSGQATWAGYIKLDDTATWIALVDRVLSHGRSLAGLAPSTYEVNLSGYLTVGYPLGSFLPLGIGRALVGQDLAWLTDPWMAFMAAMLALALAHVARLALAGAGAHPAGDGEPAPAPARGAKRAASAARSRRAPARAPRRARLHLPAAMTRLTGTRAVPGAWQPVVIGILAAQPALLYGYYLWGGMKELASAMLVAGFAVAAPLAFEGRRRLRAAIPALVLVWALVASLSTGGLVWVGPGAVIAGALLVGRRAGIAALWERMSAARTRDAAVAAATMVVLALGAFLVLRPGGFFERFRTVLTSGTQIGNLAKPLSVAQLAGIWPTQDFRYTPTHEAITYALVVLVTIAAVAGLLVALRRLRSELVLYTGCTLVAAGVVVAAASPWVGAKALASASPALPLAALVAASLIASHWHKAAGALLAALIAIGILWSNGLGYHGVSLAPRAQFADLDHIGHLIAGQGPTFMTEYDTYGERYFLREAAPESASDLRARADLLSTGKPLQNEREADIDSFELSTILHYRTLVLQASPIGKRPPSPYRLTYRDKFWEVWQRPPLASVRPPVLELATVPAFPGTTPSCSAVMSLARTPGAAALAAAPVSNPIVLAGQGYLRLSNPGTRYLQVDVRQAGTYAVWLGGSMRGPVSISVDGASAGRLRDQLNYPGEFIPFGTVTLSAGIHRVALDFGGGDLLPGSGGPADVVGPLVLQRAGVMRPLITAPAADARSLCGRALEWVEVIGR